MIQITYDTALAALKAAVEEKGADYKYEPPLADDDGDDVCVYVHNGAPSCLVGHALHSLGVSLSDLSTHGDRRLNNVHRLLIELADRGIAVSSAVTEHLFSTVQGAQDSGIPWGEALSTAVHAVD